MKKQKLIIAAAFLTGSVVYGQSYNAGTGASAGASANNNTVVGGAAGNATATGTSNSFFGVQAGKALTTGQTNTFVGMTAGGGNTTGSDNCFIGGSAGASNTTGQYNTSVGVAAGLINSTGSGNTCIGELAGAFVNGSGNVFIGYTNSAGKSLFTPGTVNNQLFIDNTNTANPLIFGDFSARQAIINGAFQATGNIVMNNNPNAGTNPLPAAQLLLKTYGGIGSADLNHGLGYFSSYNNSAGTAVAIDGPVLYGYSGGALATTGTTNKIALRWDNSGKVYIGAQKQTSTGHASALLQVNGDVVIGTSSGGNVYVTQSNWADFVFDKNYVLMSLNEVENFYKVNHHLPNVPTTHDIQENGNNLGQTDAILLQKIEENTLYIVELKKQLEVQQKLIEEFSKKLADKK